MSAKGILKVITNYDLGGNNDTPVYPVTSTLGVYNQENKSLEDVLNNHSNAINEVTDKVSDNTIEINNVKDNIDTIKEQLNTSSFSTWDGNIVEQFQGFYSPQDSELISGAFVGTYGDILWDNIRNIFVYKVENNGTYLYYKSWMGYNRYMKDVGIPHNKLFKHDNILYYYNVDLNRLINIYDQEYLEAVEIVQTQDCIVNWEKNSALTFPDVTGNPIVYIQYPLSVDILEGTVAQFEGPVFAYRVTQGYQDFSYHIPYSNFSTYLLSKYQDMDGNIKEGLEVKINNVIYQYNSSTQTLEHV